MLVAEQQAASGCVRPPAEQQQPVRSGSPHLSQASRLSGDQPASRIASPQATCSTGRSEEASGGFGSVDAVRCWGRFAAEQVRASRAQAPATSPASARTHARTHAPGSGAACSCSDCSYRLLQGGSCCCSTVAAVRRSSGRLLCESEQL